MPVGGFAFGPFQLDIRARRLMRDGSTVPVSELQFDLLHALLREANDIVTKDSLVEAAWHGVAVADNTLAQAIVQLRRILGDGPDHRYIKTVSGRGYRWVAPTSRIEARRTDAELDALLAPHRALIDGRTALLTLERAEIERARSLFERLVVDHPDDATVHVGLANACVLHFESTRADAPPDTSALHFASLHAREACRLNPEFAEAWATRGFVLERSGERPDALAALRHALTLEPYSWRHLLRLAFVSWGEERLRAARRTLEQLPDCSQARWLAATVYVARDALKEAERELDAGLAAIPSEAGAPARLAAVGLHLLRGLLCLARGADDEALAELERELVLEPFGHLYARECTANTWYAIGACRLRQGDQGAARTAFEQAIARIPQHAMAHAGLALLSSEQAANAPLTSALSVDAAMTRAVTLVAAGDTAGAAQLVGALLASAPPGNAGWQVPIEPLLNVQQARAVWASVLGVLRMRAA